MVSRFAEDEVLPNCHERSPPLSPLSPLSISLIILQTWEAASVPWNARVLPT